MIYPPPQEGTFKLDSYQKVGIVDLQDIRKSDFNIL